MSCAVKCRSSDLGRTPSRRRRVRCSTRTRSSTTTLVTALSLASPDGHRLTDGVARPTPWNRSKNASNMTFTTSNTGRSSSTSKSSSERFWADLPASTPSNDGRRGCVRCLWLTLADPEPQHNGQYVYSGGLIDSVAAAGVEIEVLGLQRLESTRRNVA